VYDPIVFRAYPGDSGKTVNVQFPPHILTGTALDLDPGPDPDEVVARLRLVNIATGTLIDGDQTNIKTL
jgi:hypothetical protein